MNQDTQTTVIDLEGKEHTETHQPSIPQLVEQMKQVLLSRPEAIPALYFWMNTLSKDLTRRI